MHVCKHVFDPIFLTSVQSGALAVNRSEDLSLPFLKASAIQSLVWLPLLHSGRQADTTLASAAMATLLGFFMFKRNRQLSWLKESVCPCATNFDRTPHNLKDSV